MALSRRTLIRGVGASGLALVAAGATWRVTRLPVDAVRPWAFDPTPLPDIRLDAFRHAILAPNPHNRQPWLIKLEGARDALLTCDLAKRLPETDPFDRQITIGFGTFIEIARIAAAQRGNRIEIDPFPNGTPDERLDGRPIARLRFISGAAAAPDPLYPAIICRHTNRQVFEGGRVVRGDVLAQMVSPPDGVLNDPTRIAPLRTVAKGAIRTEQLTHRTNMESVNLMRIGHTEIDAKPDGIALSGPLMEALAMAGQLDRAQLADPGSTAFKSGLDMLAETYGSIPALFWIKTPGNSRLDQLEAGRRYVRAHLRATQLGLAVHPMSQALQEYAEVSAHYLQLHQLLRTHSTERIQMFARVGYAAPVRAAARWPLEKHLIA